jgi:predicted RNase H-like HicB family nuclease
MNGRAVLQYRVIVKKDQETGSVVAEIPALHLADFGADMPEALERLQAMLAFHLDCLREEGKPIPAEGDDQEGFFLRVHAPAHAA